MIGRSKSRWLGFCVALVLAQMLVTAFLPYGYARVALTDLLQLTVVSVLMASFVAKVMKAQGKARTFWMLFAVGGIFWLGVQLSWTTYEVLLRKDVPNPFLGDSAIFLHLIPMMAALAIQPHLRSTANESRPGRGDFILLVTWWVYLYAFVVMPWQYVSLDVESYGLTFNQLYLFEHIMFLVGLGYLVRTTVSAWKSTYRALLLAALFNAITSTMVNLAIDLPDGSRYAYFSGSWYDVALLASLASWVYVVRMAPNDLKESGRPHRREEHGVWVSRMAMAAVLSLPLCALYAMYGDSQPMSVRHYRMTLTAVAFLALTAQMFFKQHQMDRRLIKLLRETREAYENQKQIQAHLVQTEKLASIGRLVAGAAHEINNPLTAILGYSDLLSTEDNIQHEHRALAEKIKLQARRTKALVSNLLTFAKQAPLRHASVDLNSVVRRALSLRELDLENRNIQTALQLDPDLGPIWGDENHLLQVCLHIFSNAADAMQGTGGGLLSVTTSHSGGQAMLSCTDTGPGVPDPSHIFDPFFTTKPVGKGTGLGLSACYGIVRDHRGEITCRNRPGGGAEFLITLPLSLNVEKVEALATHG